MKAENAVSAPWWSLSRGDMDATVAQVGFNLAQMIIPVFLLATLRWRRRLSDDWRSYERENTGRENQHLTSNGRL